MTNNHPKVRLTPYDSNWESQYKREEAAIIQAIGPCLKGIEHIGSTSVKGLDAKPIIDILAGVTSLEIAGSLVEPLKKAEFTFVHKPELTNRRFFRKGDWGIATCHLHICEFDSREWKDKVLFRDYLRRYPQAVEEYMKLKKELARLHQNDRPRYTKEKEPFIRNILKRAREL